MIRRGEQKQISSIFSIDTAFFPLSSLNWFLPRGGGDFFLLPLTMLCNKRCYFYKYISCFTLYFRRKSKPQIVQSEPPSPGQTLSRFALIVDHGDYNNIEYWYLKYGHHDTEIVVLFTWIYILCWSSISYLILCIIYICPYISYMFPIFYIHMHHRNVIFYLKINPALR